MSRKLLKKLDRRWREVGLFRKALLSSRHPILAQIVPVRRCNLTCTYCNEYDRHSDPVPLDLMKGRIDHLSRLGATMVHLSGGEPLLHPEIDEIVSHIRSRKMLAGLLTNGLLLSEKRILSLNRAGLDHLQISIDNVQPDEVSKKSLKALDRKLELLGRHAEFDVNINSVLGGDLENPEDALVIGRRALKLGLTSTLGIIHDHSGQLKPLPEQHRRVFEEFGKLGRGLFKAPSHNSFQQNIVQGRPNSWNCHAGSRYVYVCEDGLVHYCSQQRGAPGIPLAGYSREDLDRAYRAPKSCAPLCTISCVHRVSWMDRLREPPEAALAEFFPPKTGKPWSPADLPFPVRILTRLFLRDQKGRKPPLARLAEAVFK